MPQPSWDGAALTVEPLWNLHAHNRIFPASNGESVRELLETEVFTRQTLAEDAWCAQCLDCGYVSDAVPADQAERLAAQHRASSEGCTTTTVVGRIREEEFAAFDLRGLLLALPPIVQLARDGKIEPGPDSKGIRFTIGIMVDTADEVDRLPEQIRRAGAHVTKEPVDAEFFTGRSA